MREEEQRRGLIVLLILIGVGVVGGLLIWYYCQPEAPPECPECPEFEFGDDNLNAEIKPNATLKEPEVEPDISDPDPPLPGYWTDGYWSTDEVIGYNIYVPYRVNITEGINESTVLLEIKVWVTIKAWGWVMTAEEEEDDRELIIDENETVTTFGDWVEWKSELIDLPEDNSECGFYIYRFDIWIRATGDIEDTTLTLKHEIEENKFDCFTIHWYTPIQQLATVLGAVGGVVLGIGIALKIRRSKNCPCVGKPNCYCDM